MVVLGYPPCDRPGLLCILRLKIPPLHGLASHSVGRQDPTGLTIGLHLRFPRLDAIAKAVDLTGVVWIVSLFCHVGCPSGEHSCDTRPCTPCLCVCSRTVLVLPCPVVAST